MTATLITGVSLTSADADALADFYVKLGFERTGVELRGGPAFARLMRLPRAEARVVLLRLGDERLELVSFSEPGRPYPPERSSNDPWFQHFAIVVSSMEAAYERLGAAPGWIPITRPAPQRLPASSGGVTAFKFRDPEGHPLELLEFPDDGMPPVWGAARGTRSRPFLGIDHSAVVVASTATSVEFYTERLSFECGASSLNRGPEQARLDGLDAPEVQVTALIPRALHPPHLELLCYRAPAGRPRLITSFAADDIAATRLLLEVRGLERTGLRATGLETTGLETSGLEASGLEAAGLVRDPDGHSLYIVPEH